MTEMQFSNRAVAVLEQIRRNPVKAPHIIRHTDNREGILSHKRFHYFDPRSPSQKKPRYSADRPPDSVGVLGCVVGMVGWLLRGAR